MDGVPERVAQRLYEAADAARWSVTEEAFADALAASAAGAFRGRTPEPGEVEKYLGGLHLSDLALACACIAGDDEAWEHLIREYRPALYRAADAMDPTGRARDLADALWADLYRNLLRYFHGRSRLATWLRTVLAQRHVDMIRANRRLEPLPDEALLPPSQPPPDPHSDTCRRLVQRALEAAAAELDPRDRLRLACYHVQQLTLAEIGRMLHEHEATVSRHLTKTRAALRQFVERWLASEANLAPVEVRSCLDAVLEDPGALDLAPMLAGPDERKILEFARSKRGAV